MHHRFFVKVLQVSILLPLALPLKRAWQQLLLYVLLLVT